MTSHKCSQASCHDVRYPDYARTWQQPSGPSGSAPKKWSQYGFAVSRISDYQLQKGNKLTEVSKRMQEDRTYNKKHSFLAHSLVASSTNPQRFNDTGAQQRAGRLPDDFSRGGLLNESLPRSNQWIASVEAGSQVPETIQNPMLGPSRNPHSIMRSKTSRPSQYLNCMSYFALQAEFWWMHTYRHDVIMSQPSEMSFKWAIQKFSIQPPVDCFACICFLRIFSFEF